MLVGWILVALQEPVAAPPARPLGWNDFPVFVWREQYAGKPLPEELVAPFGGVILMRDEDSAWARERGLAYLVWNVAGRNALHLDADEAWNARVEKWIETHDEKLLVREPCLSAPATLAQLGATLDASLAKHAGHPGLGLVLGDEVGLTPNGDPFDLCRCALCDVRWQEYARTHDLPPRAPLTDEVRLALAADDFAGLGAWLARKRFERAQLAEVLEDLARRARRAAPEVPLGLLGIGTSAFGGIDGSGGLPFVDFVEAYSVGDARELVLGAPVRPRGAIATLFVDAEAPEGASSLAWEHWLRGGNGLVLWSDTTLARSPAHRARLAQTIERIRAIQREFPRLQSPTYERVALVHDADSSALAWLKDALLDGPTWPRRRSAFQEEHGTREQSVRRWLRSIEDLGVLPAAVPLLCLGQRRVYDVLVLAHLLVLGPEDIAALERELDLGTTLVVDGPLGWVDREGQLWKEDVLARLRARAPERVKTTLRGLAEVPAAVVRFTGDGGTVSWLIASRGLAPLNDAPNPVRLVAALPNLPRPDDRARSKPLHLAVTPPAGTRIEWIHPRDGGELPAGDAAVFLLRPED